MTKTHEQTEQFLENLTGGPLTFARIVRSTRLSDELSLAAMAAKLDVSRQYLCDVEQGRRNVPSTTAARWAKILGYSVDSWVEHAIQAELDRAGLKLRVKVEAA